MAVFLQPVPPLVVRRSLGQSWDVAVRPPAWKPKMVTDRLNDGPPVLPDADASGGRARSPTGICYRCPEDRRRNPAVEPSSPSWRSSRIIATVFAPGIDTISRRMARGQCIAARRIECRVVIRLRRRGWRSNIYDVARIWRRCRWRDGTGERLRPRGGTSMGIA